MITASIVTYYTDIEEFKRCIDCLLKTSIKRVYIVDNSSQQYIADMCSNVPLLNYIPNLNSGYGAGHNIAIKRATTEGSKYHLVLNSDIEFDSDTIDKLEAYMNSNGDVAQVQPNIIYPNGEMQYSCRLLPSPANLIFRRFLPNFMCRRMDERYLLRFNDHKSEMNVPYHQGSFIFFRTSCLQQVGLFDERFFMYPEDIDITRRMHKHFRTMYVPFATVTHHHRAASYKSTKMLLIHIKNMIKYFNKWGWFFDKERRDWNKALLKSLGYKGRE